MESEFHYNAAVLVYPVVWCLGIALFREVEFWFATFRFTFIYQLDWWEKPPAMVTPKGPII